MDGTRDNSGVASVGFLVAITSVAPWGIYAQDILYATLFLVLA